MDCSDMFKYINEVAQMYRSSTFGLDDLDIFPSIYT